MSRTAKIFAAAKQNPQGLSFAETQALAVAAGFVLKRVNGSHHVYAKTGIPEPINLQRDGKGAKGYQVKQVLGLITKYKIEIK